MPSEPLHIMNSLQPHFLFFFGIVLPQLTPLYGIVFPSTLHCCSTEIVEEIPLKCSRTQVLFCAACFHYLVQLCSSNCPQNEDYSISSHLLTGMLSATRETRHTVDQ